MKFLKESGIGVVLALTLAVLLCAASVSFSYRAGQQAGRQMFTASSDMLTPSPDDLVVLVITEKMPKAELKDSPNGSHFVIADDGVGYWVSSVSDFLSLEIGRARCVQLLRRADGDVFIGRVYERDVCP